MEHPTRHRRTPAVVERYGFALATVAGAAGLTAAGGLATGVAPFLLFPLAVALTGVRAGAGPAVAAVALSTLATHALFAGHPAGLLPDGGTGRPGGMYAAGLLGWLLARRCPPPALRGLARRASGGRPWR